MGHHRFVYISQIKTYSPSFLTRSLKMQKARAEVHIGTPALFRFERCEKASHLHENTFIAFLTSSAIACIAAYSTSCRYPVLPDSITAFAAS